MIREVSMYRLICDEPGCDKSPQDDADFWAWTSPDGALADARDTDWVIRDGLHLCGDHGYRTVCMGDDDEECSRRDDLAEADDGWVYCPDHIEQGGGAT